MVSISQLLLREQVLSLRSKKSYQKDANHVNALLDVLRDHGIFLQVQQVHARYVVREFSAEIADEKLYFLASSYASDLLFVFDPVIFSQMRASLLEEMQNLLELEDMLEETQQIFITRAGFDVVIVLTRRVQIHAI